MRIHSLDAIAIDIPLKKNFGGATYSVLKRWTVITRLRTEDGLTSEVYNGDNREHGPEIVRLIKEELAPMVLGLSIFESERIWQNMFARTVPNRDRKTLLEAISCVDCAVWDVIGKASKRSVRELIGGFRDAVPIISIGGYYMDGKTLADIGREMELYRSSGVAGCKFKVGGLSPEEDAKRVAAARQAVGKDFVLAVDANRGWTADEAIRFARLVELLDIAWFEEPCHWYDDVAGMARVRAATRIPINAGQSEITSHGVRRLLDAGAVDLINYDVSEGGGVTDWRRAAAQCWASGRDEAAPRGKPNRPAPHLRRAARHLSRVLRRSRPRSRLAGHVDKPAGPQGRPHASVGGPRLRPRARSEDDRQVPRRLSGQLGPTALTGEDAPCVLTVVTCWLMASSILPRCSEAVALRTFKVSSSVKPVACSLGGVSIVVGSARAIPGRLPLRQKPLTPDTIVAAPCGRNCNNMDRGRHDHFLSDGRFLLAHSAGRVMRLKPQNPALQEAKRSKYAGYHPMHTAVNVPRNPPSPII